MEHLYQRHFGLTQAPFNVTPDPSFLYLTSSHREGLAQLQYGIEARRGFIVLTGEVGTGKTTLIQALLSELAERTQTAFIFSSIGNALELMRYVCEEFKLIEPLQPARDFHDYICLLNDFLLRRYQQGQNAVLIIDEAQNLPSDVLESVRLLSNFETPKDKLLQILLVGQPELNDRLNAPQLRQLKQRITLRHHLRPLTANECHEYIRSRLKHARGSPAVFAPRAIETIYQYSGGLPRLINVICDNSMVNAYALDLEQIEPPLIQEVAEDLHLSASLRPALVRRDIARRTERPALQPELAKPQAIQLVNTHRVNSVADESSNSGSNRVVTPEFFVCLREDLLDAMGPMAHIVLSEHIKLLGGSLNHFSRDKIGALIDSVSGEIFDQSIRARFRQNMSAKIGGLPSA
ncbi:MAG: ExeA family protein [Candidatus Binatia bacterium]